MNVDLSAHVRQPRQSSSTTITLRDPDPLVSEEVVEDPILLA
jgi:hypothetical protein